MLKLTFSRNGVLSILGLLLAMGAALPAAAATYGYAQDAPLQVGSRALIVAAGSQYESLVVTETSFTVTVGQGQVFIVRDAAGTPLALENDGLLQPCHVIYTRENQLMVRGPKTVTVTLSAIPCSTSGYDTDTTPALSISTPNGGGTYTSDQTLPIFWTTTHGSVGDIRLSYSADGGRTYTAIADHLVNSGYYAWVIPQMPTTAHGRIRLDGVDRGEIVAVDISNADFAIAGTAAAPEPETPPIVLPPAPGTPYDPAAETAAASSIDIDRGFPQATPPSGTVACVAGLRIKGASSAAVYYCGRDGKRHSFPNQRIHDSWYQGFVGVVTLTDAQLAAVPLGANVTYRPGVRLVKITTDPKVYAVQKNGVLRWVPDEWTAKRLYGDDWNKKVDDIPDAFFGNDYSIGDRVPST